MRNDLELYIGGELVDLNTSINILFNYKVKDLTNPTTVKNSFSKTVELEKTDTNNKVFGHIWNLNRIQSDGTFNPSKRVEFALMMNGELVESGYCKLDSIKDKYSITLYGGLGDFFYNLMYDNATGEKKTLASLDYGMDLDFTINKETLYQAWLQLLDPIDDEGVKFETINFAPCYNGISDQIAADKVLINTSGVTAGMRMWDDGWVDINGFPTTSNNGEYNLVNGYGYAELPKEMNEWQMRDIRSYLQRPVIRMRSIIEACCNPENNGGYEVELDNTFFNITNPYYRYGWLTLPMLNDLGGEITEDSLSLSVGEIHKHPFELSYVNFNGVLPNADKYDVELKLRMDLLKGTDSFGNYAYTSTKIDGVPFYGAYLCYVEALDGGGNAAATSDAYWLTSYIDGVNDYYNASEASITVPVGNVQTQVGDFERVATNVYEWPSTLKFSVDTNGTRITRLRFCIIPMCKKLVVGIQGGCIFPAKSVNVRDDFYDIFRVNTLTNIEGMYVTSEGTSVNSNTYISKNTLLSTEQTPADYLIGYAKIFNLYFEKDVFKKKIYIKTQREFYDGEAIDLEELIDRSKTINITPISFDTKWYDLNYNENDQSEAEEKYYDNYGTQFGKQKLNTGYEFNAEAKKLLDIPYNNGVQVLESSKYYCVGESDFWNEIPTFLLNNVTYKLFNSDMDSTDITLSQPRGLTVGLINTKSDNGIRYDAFPKVQFHNGNDAIDGKNVLLFFNGFQTIRSDGHYQPKYMITDDLNEMFVVDDDKPCWLYTKAEYDTLGNRIAIEMNALPQFSRYTTVEKTDDVYYSWDFGRTKELYVPDYKFTSSESTVYERYWRSYLNDLYDIDTRIVECYVKFDEKVMADALKHYYYFDNSYWVLNEILEYNPASYDTTKCRFVKVNNLQAYTDYNPAITPDGTIVITLYNPNVGATGGVVNGYVYVGDGGAWSFTSWDNGLTPSITGGVGSQHFTLSVSGNFSDVVKSLHITATRNGYSDTAIVIQESGGIDFKVTPSGLTYYNTGGTQELIITDPMHNNWRIVGYPDWCTFSEMSGDSSTVIQVTARENSTGLDREGTIVVYDLTEHKTYTVNVKQTDIQGDSAHLRVEQFAQYTWGNVPQTGGTCFYSVWSTSPWQVTSDREYCVPLSTSGTGNPIYGQTLQVQWPLNTSYSYRNAILTFTNDEGYEVKVYKNQDGINLTNLNFDATGETEDVQFDTDADVVTKPDWINVTTDGNGNYYLTADPNQTQGDRDSQVILTNPDGQELTINVHQDAGSNDCCDLITSFRVIPTELYYEGNGGIQYFFINNPNGDSWALSGYSWGTPNINNGHSSAIIAFTVPANTGSERFEYITVDNITNSGDTKMVYVHQGTGSTRTITVNPQSINAVASGGTYQVTITVDNYNPSSDVVSETHSSGIGVGAINFTGNSAVVDITVPQNTTESGKTYTVTFTLNGTTSVTLTITQDGNQFYLTVTPTLINTSESGDTYTVVISTNDPNGWRIN